MNTFVDIDCNLSLSGLSILLALERLTVTFAICAIGNDPSFPILLLARIHSRLQTDIILTPLIFIHTPLKYQLNHGGECSVFFGRAIPKLFQQRRGNHCANTLSPTAPLVWPLQPFPLD